MGLFVPNQAALATVNTAPTLASNLPAVPLFRPLTLDSFGSATAGSDAAGSYAALGTATAQTYYSSTDIPLVAGTAYTVVLRMRGRVKNQIKFNFFDASGTYVSNAVTYCFSSSGTDLDLPAVADYVPLGATSVLAASFVAPATGVASARLEISTDAGTTTYFYGRVAAPTATLPRAPLTQQPFPFKGMSFQKLNTNLFWLGDGTVTAGYVQSWLKTKQQAYRFNGMRLWGGLDAGMNVDQNGVFVSFKPAVAANMALLDQACRSSRIGVILCVFTPLTFTGGPDMNRAIMTDATVRAGYQAAAAQFAQICDALPSIVGFDIANEPHYAMAHKADGTGAYTPAQINVALSAISDGLRSGSSKPVILSAADGPSAAVAFSTLDPTKYDVASYHSYGAVARYYQPQVRKPLILGEMGPGVTTTDPVRIAVEGVPVLYDAVGKASCAYVWENGFLDTSPAFATEFANF